MVPNSSRIRTYRFPLRNAARATRAVSSGTGPIACGCSDIVFLLLNAFPQFKELHTLSFLHLSKPHRMLSIAFSVRQRYLESIQKRVLRDRLNTLRSELACS